MFNLEKLVRSFQKGNIEALANEINGQFHLWVRNDVGSKARRTNLLFESLEKHAMTNVEKPLLTTCRKGQQRHQSQPKS